VLFLINSRIIFNLITLCILAEVLLIHWSVFNILHIRGLLQILLFGLLAPAILAIAKIPTPGLMAKTYLLLTLYGLFLSLGYGAETIAEYVIKGPMVSLATYFVLYLALLRTNNEETAKWIRQLVNAFISAVLLSNIVAIGQYLNLDFFWEMRDFSISDYSSVVNASILERHRPVGLSSNSVELGYHTIMAVSFLAFKTKNKLNAACFIFLVLGQIACENRSSIATILIFVIFFWNSRWSMLIKPVFITLLLIIILYFGAERLSNVDSALISKIFLIYFGLIYLVQNPFGSGLTMVDFINFRKEYDFTLISNNYLIADELSRYTPHNQVLTTMLIYGVLGLFSLIYVHIYAYKNAKIYKGKHINYVRSFNLMITLYFINSMVHNAGIFVMDPVIWYFIPLFEFIVRQKR